MTLCFWFFFSLFGNFSSKCFVDSFSSSHPAKCRCPFFFFLTLRVFYPSVSLYIYSFQRISPSRSVNSHRCSNNSWMYISSSDHSPKGRCLSTCLRANFGRKCYCFSVSKVKSWCCLRQLLAFTPIYLHGSSTLSLTQVDTKKLISILFGCLL